MFNELNEPTSLFPPSFMNSRTLSCGGALGSLSALYKLSSMNVPTSGFSPVPVKDVIISYLSYKLHCCTLPDKRCLSQGICLNQVMMTLHFLNDVANDTESTQK